MCKAESVISTTELDGLEEKLKVAFKRSVETESENADAPMPGTVSPPEKVL